MKHIKLFEQHQSNQEIHRLCKEYHIYDYTINSDGSIDVNENVVISKTDITEIPLHFGIINGNFYCDENKLTSLKGCPVEVRGYFSCSNNKLTSLEYAPKYVSEYFICISNELTSLVGSPMVVNNFNCSRNKLTSLEGCPIEVKEDFQCSFNSLTSLDGCPKEVELFNCEGNNLTSLEGCPEYVDSYFDCEDNKLTSLIGCPMSFGESFNHADFHYGDNPLPDEILQCNNIVPILKYHQEYSVWSEDGTFNLARFNLLKKDIERPERLLNILLR